MLKLLLHPRTFFFFSGEREAGVAASARAGAATADGVESGAWERRGDQGLGYGIQYSQLTCMNLKQWKLDKSRSTERCIIKILLWVQGLNGPNERHAAFFPYIFQPVVGPNGCPTSSCFKLILFPPLKERACMRVPADSASERDRLLCTHSCTYFSLIYICCAGDI